MKNASICFIIIFPIAAQSQVTDTIQARQIDELEMEVDPLKSSL